MGGYGSGRAGSGRGTTNEYLRMDVSFMAKQGFLREHASSSLHWSRGGERIGTINFRTEADKVVLSYRCRQRGDDWESLEYAVRLERTPCRFGGFRTWFLCPAGRCGRRVAFLYGGRIYACRNCYRLAYLSQRQSLCDRRSDRAAGILKRLRCDDWLTIFDTDPPRPKGMHERTYRRLAARYEIARYHALRTAPSGLGEVFGSLWDPA